MKKEVFAYIRTSNTNKKAAEESDSKPRQLKSIRAYARKRGWKIKAVYEDIGVSGDNGMDLSQREGYSEMLADMESDGINIFVVADATRYARSLITAITMNYNLNQKGIQAFDASIGKDLAICGKDNPEDALTRNIMLCYAEYESAKSIEKLQGARHRKKESGGYIGGTKKLGTNENDRLVLDRIKELKLQKNSQKKIAEILNKEGFTNRRGGAFSQMTVSNYCKELGLKKFKL